MCYSCVAEYQRAVFSTDLSNCTPCSGHLSRKSSKGFWQKRWFYLNNQFLIYKKDEQATESKGVMGLHEISSINTNANVLEMVRSWVHVHVSMSVYSLSSQDMMHILHLLYSQVHCKVSKVQV